MWIENHNIDELPQNEGKEKKDIQKDIQKYTPHINKEIQQNSMKAQQKDSLEADRLIASVDFNVSKWKEISEWKVNFTIADIQWNIDIDNDKLTINGKSYNIQMPKWADLVWITVLDWKIKVKWERRPFTGSWHVSDEKFKEEMIKLSSQDIKKDIIHTESWDLILSKL